MALWLPGPSRAVSALWTVTIVGLVSPEPMIASTRVRGASLKAASSTLARLRLTALPARTILLPSDAGRHPPGLAAATRNRRSVIGHGHALVSSQASRSRGRNASKLYSGTAHPTIFR